jgi:ABC-type phosphate transport system substrate-binding protein
MRMFAVSVILVGLCVSLAAAETVVVNAKSPVVALSDDAMRDYFLGKKTVWEDGSRVVVVVLKEGPSHDGLMKLLGKNPSQFSTGWKKLVFTGKGAMPEQIESEAALVDFVARTPGAIGFVDAGMVKEGVKAVPIR